MAVFDGCVERRPRRARLAAIVSAAVILSALAPAAAHADVCTWTGAGGDDLWSTSANWTCSGAHLVPADGDVLVFPSATPRFEPANDLVGLIVESITIEDPQYELSGNGIFLNLHLTSSPSVAGNPSVSLPITLNQFNTDIVVSNASAELTVTGPIIGGPATTLTKQGAGVLTLSNPANAWPSATIAAGVLRLGASGVLPDAAQVGVHGTLDLNGHNEAIGSLVGGATGTVALGNSTLTVTQTVNGNSTACSLAPVRAASRKAVRRRSRSTA
jgi:hypothetical protein